MKSGFTGETTLEISNFQCCLVPSEYNTGVCEKRHSSGEEGAWENEPSNTESGAGYQFLPLDRRAKASRKGVFVSQTPVLLSGLEK